MGSVLGVVDGAWAAYVAWSAASPSAALQLQQVLIAVGAILLVDSLVSFSGLRLAFVVGSLLCAVLLVLVLLSWGAYATSDAASIAALSVMTLAVDAVGSRPSRGLSEKDSPLNLPVFG